MKYNIINLLLAILLTSLSVIVCQQDFYACKAVSQELVGKLDALINTNTRSPEGFETILSYWTTTQYRCHRCYLVEAIKRMDMLQSMFNNDQYDGTAHANTMMNYVFAIKHNLHWTCYNPWLYAIRDNDITSNF
ncbi:hypothetical protein EDC94DRAFT_657887 [Helicostylum pulchrum]|nr:hypothetical protein EDC94DRAFT_657887 [Helicostylum pulchrum]